MTLRELTKFVVKAISILIGGLWELLETLWEELRTLWNKFLDTPVETLLVWGLGIFVVIGLIYYVGNGISELRKKRQKHKRRIKR